MLSKTPTTSLLRRISILTAIGTASLAFAATASAQPPVNTVTAKKGCTLSGGGVTFAYDDGAEVTIVSRTGSKTKMKCNNGRWEVISPLIEATSAPVSYQPVYLP
jgi:predicted lipoprotein with Yx(FWY)xxD motif